jgi:hypothetical protein
MPEWSGVGEPSDFFFVETKDADDGAAKVVEIVRDRIPRRFGLDPIRAVQLLYAMRRGALGARVNRRFIMDCDIPDHSLFPIRCPTLRQMDFGSGIDLPGSAQILALMSDGVRDGGLPTL